MQGVHDEEPLGSSYMDPFGERLHRDLLLSLKIEVRFKKEKLLTFSHFHPAVLPTARISQAKRLRVVGKAECVFFIYIPYFLVEV